MEGAVELIEKMGNIRGILEDTVLTLTRISAQATCEHYRDLFASRKPISKIYMAAGGAHNSNVTD